MQIKMCVQYYSISEPNQVYNVHIDTRECIMRIA